MSLSYYFSDFDEVLGFPKKLVNILMDDIVIRKSFVYICSDPDGYEITDKHFDISKNWFQQAGIIFEEYYIVDYRIQKEEAKALVSNASVIFLCGGNPFVQIDFLEEYELKKLIKNCDNIIMGISAGAINMSLKSLCSKDEDVNETIVYEGIGIDDITVEPHFCPKNVELLQNELFPLSNKMRIYGLCDGAVIRIKDDEIIFLGDAYLVFNSSIKKLATYQ